MTPMQGEIPYRQGEKIRVPLVNCHYCGEETEACIDTGLPSPQESPPVTATGVRPHNNEYLRPVDRQTTVRPKLCESCIVLDAENYKELTRDLRT